MLHHSVSGVFANICNCQSVVWVVKAEFVLGKTVLAFQTKDSWNNLFPPVSSPIKTALCGIPVGEQRHRWKTSTVNKTYTFPLNEFFSLADVSQHFSRYIFNSGDESFTWDTDLISIKYWTADRVSRKANIQPVRSPRLDCRADRELSVSGF